MELRGIPFFIHRGQVVEVDGDVLGVLDQIKRIDDRLSVWWNEFKEEFMVIENCLDGTDRLVFSVPELDQRVVDRLMLADQWRGRSDPDHMLGEDEDFLTHVDAEQEALDKRKREVSQDKMGEIGERIAWAMEFDGKGVHAQISVPRSVDGSTD